MKPSHLMTVEIADYFNRLFTISKLDRHTYSRETRLVYREIKRKSLTSAETFTTDQVANGISNCSNIRSFGHDKLSIFHLKNPGPKAIEYLTALFNDSVTSCRIPATWKSSIFIPIPKPGRTLLYALHIGLSHFSAQQQKLWRFSCLPVSTSTC